MGFYEKLIELLEKELKQFSTKNDISSNSLEMIDLITHSIKSIETIMAMRGYTDEYSGTYPYYIKDYGTSHARRRGDTHFGTDMGRYSGTSSPEQLMRELEQMKANAPDDMKWKFQNMIDEMRR